MTFPAPALAASGRFAPFDWHAFAPLIIVGVTVVVVLVADLVFERKRRVLGPRLAMLGLLVALIPVVMLWNDVGPRGQQFFGGALVVDRYALAFQALFLVIGYLTLFLSLDYIADGDYYQSEYYFLLLTSVLGMMFMATARDLVSIFIALETISIPTFILAGWRKHDTRSNEAMLKYYLFGVLASAVMLYGMSLVFGLSGGTTVLTEIAGKVAEAGGDQRGLWIFATFAVLVGFAFKVSAVPFHFWAPDTYEGAPTPVTAFLSVASKAGGFVALTTVVYLAFSPQANWWQPVIWLLAAASMFVGNLTALRQTNMVRLLAYSSIAQAGFILVPLAVAGDNPLRLGTSSSVQAVIIYLAIYAAMNLGAFACVIGIARTTRSAEISSYSGLYQRNPALTIVFSVFLFSLAGIPPLAGWFAKLVMFRAVFDAGTGSAAVLGVIAAVNSVIALYYYVRPVRSMIFGEVPEGASAVPVRVSPTIGFALAITLTLTVVIGVFPGIVGWVGETAKFALGAR